LDEPIFSARWDLLISARINGSKCALIAEFKTGYYPVAEADTNPQTKAQAALAYYEEAHRTGEPYAKVATAVLQRSNVLSARPIVVYVAEPPELEAELEKIESEVLAAESPGAELRTGNHCALCSAVHSCKAFKLLVQEVNDMGEKLGFIRTARSGKRRSEPVDPTRGIDKEQLAQFIASANVVNTALSRAKETAHAILQRNPNSFNGSLYLHRGRVDPVVKDALAAYRTLQRLAAEAGGEVDIERYLKITSVSAKDLEAFAKTLTRRDESELREMLDALITRKPRNPSLKIRGG
jgi:hypothetical protein